MVRSILATGLVLALAACATPPANKSAKLASANTNAQGQKLICVKSQAIGSHLPERTCYTKAEHDARQKADQESVQNMHTVGQSPISGAPPK